MGRIGKREWARNAIALGIVALFLVVVGAILWRPAAVLGVDGGSLAQSLGGEVGRSYGDCVEQHDGEWLCTVSDASGDQLRYEVRTHRFGCWNAGKIRWHESKSHDLDEISGCIGLLDELTSGDSSPSAD
jgi:hypothetical protein